MEKIAFKGDGTEETGRKIIETLEKMGGVNRNLLDGDMKDDFLEAYLIDNNRSIRWIEPPSDYRILTIEQYEAEQAKKGPLDLTKVLEGCEGMELYCLLYGVVTLDRIREERYSIFIKTPCSGLVPLTSDGRYFYPFEDGECVLFPSKDNRDWSTFKRPAKVIFTNCVGEVFTEEDVKKNIEVWVGSISGKGLNRILNCPICDLTRDIFRGNDYETDIFRSKKSLLKYLYETCE